MFALVLSQCSHVNLITPHETNLSLSLGLVFSQSPVSIRNNWGHDQWLELYV